MSEEKFDFEDTQHPVGADPSVECSMCGRTGGPDPGCQLCQGDQRYVQKRHYTSTEERTGQNPDSAKRYGPTGQVGPERVVGDVVMPKR